MPKPSFMQTVLRKPTRSYADPYAPSPWADYDDDRSSVGGYGQYPASKYSRQMDNGVHLGFKQGYLNDAGPSSEAYATRRAKNTTTTSTVSDSQRAMGTRFPKPVKKAQSTISLRETGRNVVVDEYSLEEPTRSGTVRRKKKKAIGQGSDAGSSTNSRSSSPVPPPARSTTKKRTKMQQVIRHDDEHSSVVSSQSSLPDYARPPPLHARGDSQTSSSIASLPRNSQTNAKATASRPAVAAIQKHFPPGVTSPPTPPLSDRDSTESALTHERQKTSTVRPSPQRQPSIPEVKEAVPPVPARNPKRVSISSVQASDDGEETFHTPQPSPSTPSHARESVVPRVAALAVPQFSVQPPTPDAINEPAETPFHSASTTSATSPAGPSSPLAAKDVANPLAANGTNPAPGISAQMIKLALEEEVRQTAEPVEMDAESDHGEAGSDPDDSSPTDERLSAAAAVAARRGSRQHSRQSSLAGDRPRSKLGSRPPSVIMSAGSEYDGRRPVSRQSTTRSSSRNNFDDFVVRRHSPPESVYSAAPPGSVSGISGYGKGGWAAAHSARSGSSTPVMYMPAGGSTGWEEFQRPPSQQQRFPPLHPSSLAATAPPRQSKFTPLPLAAQPHTFNRIVHGVQGEDRSVPSSYSQGSDDESDEEYAQLPKASRSYKRTSPENGSERYESELGDRYPDNRSQVSMTRSEARFEETLRQRQMVLGAPVSPYNDTTSPVPGPKSPRRFSGAASMGDLRANGGRYPALPVPVMPRALTTSFDQYESQGGYEQSHASVPISPTSRSRPASRMDYDRDASRPTSPAMSMASRPASRMGFDPPSFLNPDTLTVLPEMSLEDSARTYMPPDPTEPSESGRSRRRSSTRRSHSVLGAFRKGTSSRGGRSRAGSDDEDEEDERDQVGELKVRRAKSSIGFRDPGSTSLWESSSVGDGVLMESNGRGAESVSGYTNLILPAGAYKSSNPAKSAAEINSRILGMPHASMAAIVFSTVANRDTPAHLRDQSPPVDFSSHLKPPGKVGNGQLLVQVYATAIDEIDVRALDQKGRGDIGKWVPGRSFVGRCMATGPEEKDLVRGDIVMGIMDVKKSGTLAEYILCDRRRIARAPHPTTLSLEQMALLPVQGIAAARAVRLYLGRGKRALIMNPFQGVPALVCQELSRSGVNVTAIISGGDDHHDPQVECYNNGARGVLIGSPAAVMMGVNESGWDYVLVTEKNSRIYDAATRILKDGGKIVSLVQPESALPASIAVQQRTSGFKTLKMAFKSKKKDAKHVNFEYIPPTGSGEPAVDSSGVDYRDVMEEECMNHFRPVLDHPAIFFEKARDAFVGGGREGSKVVRIVN